jgi:ribosome-binding factor A
LRAIGLKDRNDPITEMIAKKIIEIAQTGVRDPAQISTLAIKEIGIS